MGPQGKNAVEDHTAQQCVPSVQTRNLKTGGAE